MKPKINIIFPNINIDMENILVETLDKMGFDVSFTYDDENKDLTEIHFQEEASKEVIKRIVLLIKRYLENVKAHIGVDDDIEQAVAFLRGINAACRYLGLPADDNTRDEVLKKYGFTTVTLYPVEDLKAKGYEYKRIINELIKIELEIWEKRSVRTGSS